MQKCDLCSKVKNITHSILCGTTVKLPGRTIDFSNDVIPQFFESDMRWELNMICENCIKFITDFFLFYEKIRTRLISENKIPKEPALKPANTEEEETVESLESVQFTFEEEANMPATSAGLRESLLNGQKSKSSNVTSSLVKPEENLASGELNKKDTASTWDRERIAKPNDSSAKDHSTLLFPTVPKIRIKTERIDEIVQIQPIADPPTLAENEVLPPLEQENSSTAEPGEDIESIVANFDGEELNIDSKFFCIL